MSLRTASQSPSTLTGKLQAQYVTHKPSPLSPPTPGMLPIADLRTQRSPALAGLSSGGIMKSEYHTAVPDECKTKVSTTLQYQTSVRLAPPLRQRCDGHHKNALFCQVLQKSYEPITAACVRHLGDRRAIGRGE